MAKPARTEVIVPGARVLAVGQPRAKGGQRRPGRPADPAQVVPVTFALTKRQELKVAHAQAFAADVRLALLPPGDRRTPSARSARRSTAARTRSRRQGGTIG